MKNICTIWLLLFASLSLSGKVVLPYIFSDHMVLQRNKPIKIWGKADPGEKIEVTFKKQKNAVTADRNGNWETVLKSEKEGGPFDLKIKADNTVIFKNILIGDVWLCSGQSNMEWLLKNSEGYEKEILQKNFPQIRQIKIPLDLQSLPQFNTLPTEWKIANQNNIGDFSGVAYYFAKKMYEETGIPVGIINSSWGGSVVEAWIPKDAFLSDAYFHDTVAKMPEVNLDELKQMNYTIKEKLVEKLQHRKISDFKETDFLNGESDDSGYTETFQPKGWELQGYEGIDGIIWIRKTVELTPEDCKNPAVLHLGKIDDDDITYFNGKKVGGTKQYDADRIYTLPQELLKPGKSSIVVKITDNGGGGGLWSKEEDVFLQTSNRKIPLAGNWKTGVEKIFTQISQNEFPSMIYNAMIAPLVPYRIAGILWYQGESNADRAAEYNNSFPLLINSWRQKMGEELPFYFAQLSSFTTPGNNSNEGSTWAELREAQVNTLSLKNTGMVVTTDVGNAGDIHPRNKKTVGERFADLALKNGKKSPVYKKSTVSGAKIIVEFSPSAALKSGNNEPLKGFEIAGKDRVFYPAEAEIKENKVIIFSDKVKEPVAARYGWKGDDSEINLFTQDGLPVSPFRTDHFKLVTENVKFKILD